MTGVVVFVAVVVVVLLLFSYTPRIPLAPSPPHLDVSCSPPLIITVTSVLLSPMGGDLAPNLGGPKIFCGPISVKISIFRVKISDDLFLVINLVLRIFPFLSHIFRMFTVLNVVYDHFLTRKTQFFTLFMLSRTSDNTTSQNIGGTNAWAVPPPKILGGTVPPVPLGLRL